MAIVLPLGTDTLSSDNHALMHNVYAIDSSAPAQSSQVNANGHVRVKTLRRGTGTVVTNTGSTLTLTAANIVLGAIFQQTGTTAPTFTLDTGSAVSALIPDIAVGDMIQFIVSNASNQTITMAGASGTTLANAMTVPTLTTRTFYAINTASNAWTIY